MPSLSSPLSRLILPAALLLIAAWNVRAERPPAPELLPKNTAALIRIPSVPELKEKFMSTQGGKLYQDEKIAPLFAELYGSATEMFQQLEEDVGVSLPELLSIPQGEMAAAVIAPQGRQPMYVLLIDAGEQKDAAQKLLDKAVAALEKETGNPGVEEDLDGQKVKVFRLGPDEPKELVVFEREGTFAAITNKTLTKEMLVRWAGIPGKPVEDSLAKNERYNAIMKRCRGEKNQSPQITFFVDPLTIARSATAGNFAATATMALLPSLGLDGFSGLGGSMTLDAEPYDYIMHLHLLLENPRTGALEALALQAGDYTPPAWVPADANSYMSLNWDFRKTYEEVGKLVDLFQGEGRTEKAVTNFVTEEWGLDFHKDILDQLTGRVVHIMWLKPPAKIDSQIQGLAIQVKDPEAAKASMKTITDKFKDNIEEKTVAGVTYYRPKLPPRTRREREGGDAPDAQPAPATPEGEADEDDEGPFPMPVVALIDDTLIVTRAPLLRKIAVARRDPNYKSLADTDEYKLVASRFDRFGAGNKPGLVTYSQPEESMRWLYEFATGPQAKEFLENPDAPEPVKKLNAALTKHPLPPFSVIQQYLAPTGGVGVNEPTGFHYTGFGLRRAAP